MILATINKHTQAPSGIDDPKNPSHTGGGRGIKFPSTKNKSSKNTSSSAQKQSGQGGKKSKSNQPADVGDDNTADPSETAGAAPDWIKDLGGKRTKERGDDL